MPMPDKTKLWIGLFLCLILIGGCKTVKPYQRIYLNDSEMQIGNTSARNFENYVQSIREGATMPGGAKSSGGCGCN
ncbi:protein of unknown function [Pseudarcicella hirudinis]|uniref:DUF4266 domain-containing protein n=2 Tax=Pseudarcicella hirudinis TaxID=1079859 RepID=A0A1I5USM4_9BACT|nr:protein of unknown function [Pseudarcicella hirudinis]